MINIIPSEKRHHADHGWLDTHWHFSFGDYYDPSNMHWGALRVFNDDIIQGGGGFDLHPHENMEIITVITEGALRHRDSLGNSGVIRPGEVQVMSAGSGIMHAEFNDLKTEPTHLMQIWILPKVKNIKPRWEQKQFDPAEQSGKLLPVVSDGSIPGTLTINQNASIYLSRLDDKQATSYILPPHRHGYVFVVDGQIELNGQKLSAGDQARIEDERDLKFTGRKDAQFILLDVP